MIADIVAEPEESRTFKRLWLDGMPLSEIGRVLESAGSLGGLSSWRKALGLPERDAKRRPLWPEDAAT